jgi:Ca2+-binding RTX toxin-like protein
LKNGDPLPEWLTFDSESLTFSGIPPYGVEGETFIIKVTASDGSPENGGLSISDQFVLTINETATDDMASMTENQVLFVDVLGNDFPGTQTSKALTDLGDITITGPNGVPLGTPAIVIENNQIRITPGTAFDALAVNETATITVPYMMTANGVTYDAIATIKVKGTNDAPHFSFSTLPEGASSIGQVQEDTTFGGLDAVRLTTAGAGQSQIEEFLHLDHGALSTIQPDTEDGSAVAFDLKLAQNETVTFSWNFASTEYTPFDDYAFFSVASETTVELFKLSDIPAIGDNLNDGFLHSSGWQTSVYTAEIAGDYRFGIGVLNEGDDQFDSDLYLSGFSGFNFKRTTTESGPAVTFDLLNGAIDPDTNDNNNLSTSVVGWSGKNDLGEEIPVPTGAVNVNGNSVTIDPSFFSYLSAGQSISVIVNYDLSDGHVTTRNSATLVVNGVNDAPNDITFTASESIATAQGSSGLDKCSVLGQVAAIDPDNGDILDYSLGEGSSERFTLSDDGVLSTGYNDVVSETYNLKLVATDKSGASTTKDLTVWIDDNDNNGSSTKSLSSYSSDVIAFGRGGHDAITGGSGNDVLVGGSGNDTLNGRAGNDTLIGGADADTFVFTPDSGHDTITDFNSSQGDLIDLRAFENLNFDNLTIEVVGAAAVLDLGDGNKITVQDHTILAETYFLFHQSGNLIG